MSYRSELIPLPLPVGEKPHSTNGFAEEMRKFSMSGNGAKLSGWIVNNQKVQRNRLDRLQWKNCTTPQSCDFVLESKWGRHFLSSVWGLFCRSLCNSVPNAQSQSSPLIKFVSSVGLFRWANTWRHDWGNQSVPNQFFTCLISESRDILIFRNKEKRKRKKNKIKLGSKKHKSRKPRWLQAPFWSQPNRPN